MKTFFYMGRNDRNQSGVSWKIWKIERKGKRLQTCWGPAEVVQRRVIPKYTLQCWSRSLGSEAAAQTEEARRIGEKLKEGYERKLRRK